jgi:YD repeat-containing protein
LETVKFGREPGTSPAAFDTYTYEYGTCSSSIPLGETRVTDPRMNTTRYIIEDLTILHPGPTQIIDAAGRVTKLTYDDFYNITDMEQALQQKHWDYEATVGSLGRLLSVSHIAFLNDL